MKRPAYRDLVADMLLMRAQNKHKGRYPAAPVDALTRGHTDPNHANNLTQITLFATCIEDKHYELFCDRRNRLYRWLLPEQLAARMGQIYVLVRQASRENSKTLKTRPPTATMGLIPVCSDIHPAQYGAVGNDLSVLKGQRQPVLPLRRYLRHGRGRGKAGRRRSMAPRRYRRPGPCRPAASTT